MNIRFRLDELLDVVQMSVEAVIMSQRTTHGRQTWS